MTDPKRDRIAEVLWKHETPGAVVPKDGWIPPNFLSAADKVLAEVGDEHHTMDELYDYRMAYHAFTVRHWQHLGYPTVKSRRHADGELCFGGGWFIVVTSLPEGQVSNHYKDEFWDLFAVPEGTPPEYDGHTPQIALDRLFAHLRSTTR